MHNTQFLFYNLQAGNLNRHRTNCPDAAGSSCRTSAPQWHPIASRRVAASRLPADAIPCDPVRLDPFRTRPGPGVSRRRGAEWRGVRRRRAPPRREGALGALVSARTCARRLPARFPPDPEFKRSPERAARWRLGRGAHRIVFKSLRGFAPERDESIRDVPRRANPK